MKKSLIEEILDDIDWIFGDKKRFYEKADKLENYRNRLLRIYPSKKITDFPYCKVIKFYPNLREDYVEYMVLWNRHKHKIVKFNNG